MTTLAIDHTYNYLSETLESILSEQASARHVARVAFLYLSRQMHLTNQDYVEHLPTLFTRIFGEYGWVITTGWLSTLAINQLKPSRPLLDGIHSNLADTFDEKKYGKPQVSAFRIVHLLSPTEPGNLYHFIFFRPHSECSYFFPVSQLPPSIRTSYLQWYNLAISRPDMDLDSFTQRPPLLEALSLVRQSSVEINRMDSIALDIGEFYLFRCVSWFACFNTMPADSPGAGKYWASGMVTSTGGDVAAIAAAEAEAQSKRGISPTSQSNATQGTAGSTSKAQIGVRQAPPLRTIGGRGPISMQGRRMPGTMSNSLNRQQKSRQAGLTLRLYRPNALQKIIESAPAYEVLLHMIRDLLPHAGMPNLEAYKLASLGDSFLRHRWIFLQAICEFWLNRDGENVPVVTGQFGIQPVNGLQGGGGLMQTGMAGMMSPSSNAIMNDAGRRGGSGGIPLPSLGTIYALFMVFSHLHTDPQLRDADPRGVESGQQVDGGSSALASLGITSELEVMRKPFLLFFVSNAGSVPSRYAFEWTTCVDLWLLYLQPWGAAARMTPARAVSHTQAGGVGVRGATANDANRSSVGGGNTNNINGSRNPNGSINANFTSEFSWFVVQHYFVYTYVLQIVCNIVARQFSEEMELVLARLFSPTGAFNRGVVAVLLACELIVQDELRSSSVMTGAAGMMNLPSLVDSLNNLIATRYDTSQQTPSTPASTTNNSKNTTSQSPATSGPDDATVQRILMMLEADKDAVMLMLKTQASELQWDISVQGLPSLNAIIGDADLILQHIYGVVDRHPSPVSRSKNAASAAASWFPGAVTPPPKTVDYGAHFAPTAAHLCETFQLEPRRVSRPSVLSTQVPLSDRDVMGAPETESTMSIPPWVRRPVSCAYRRLTALGREQLESGRRVDLAESQVNYVGDTLKCPPPICSYEIIPAVKALHVLSIWLNQALGLDAKYVTANNSGLRVNLRILADARALAWAVCVVVIVNAFWWKVRVLAVWAPSVLAMLFAATRLRGGAMVVGVGAIIMLSAAVLK